MYENKKDTNFLLVLFTSIIYVFIAIFIVFLIGLSRVNAQSYYFDNPRNHRLCEGPFNNTIACHNENSTIVNSASPGLQKGNYIIATYRADLNINGVSGSSFEAGRYQVEFSGYFTTIQNTDLDTKVIKAKLLYYPNSSNEYAVATCDNSESFRVTKTKTDEDYNFYYYSYTCETLQITTGKTFLGYQVYVDTASLVNYIDYSVITKNLTLIGEGDATNNDVINNANQNTQDIINNQNQNTQEIIDSVTNPDISGSNDTIGGFFGSFSDTDHGGLSGIITAPLIAFNQMLTGTCNDLSVEYKGSTTTLPCGTSFWNQISPIRDFLNITLGGLICYQIIRKLFLLIQKIKNPDDDRVEVMSL